MERRCVRCDRPFSAKRSSAKYCGSSCRGMASQERARAGGEVVDLSSRSVATEFAQALLGGMPDNTGERPRVYRMVEQRLSVAKKLETTGGQQALFLAFRLENSQGDTGSAIAALSRELDRVLTMVLDDVKTEPDALDQAQGSVLQLRRRRA